MNESDRLTRDKAVLREREDSMRLLIESLQEYAIFLLDANGRIATWNAGAERLNGYRADEIIGKHFSCFYPEEERAIGRFEQADEFLFDDDQARVFDCGRVGRLRIHKCLVNLHRLLHLKMRQWNETKNPLCAWQEKNLRFTNLLHGMPIVKIVNIGYIVQQLKC